MKKTITILILIIMTLTSCNSGGNDTDSSQKNQINKITFGAFFKSDRNPLSITSSFNEPVNFLIYDGLYTLNEKLEPMENLAKEIEISNGGYDVNITIKPNISFHDGSQFTSQDVVSTINFIISDGGYYAYNVRNIESATVISTYNLRLRLKSPAPNIKMQLTFPIICRKDLLNAPRTAKPSESPEGTDAPAETIEPTPSARTFRLNGTGAYKIASETAGKQILLTKNLQYHTSFHSNAKEIEISLIPDRQTARSLSASGILDAFYAAFHDEGIKTVTKSETTKSDYPTDEYTFLKFNQNNKLFEVKALRKAMSLAIDRTKIEQDIYISHAAEAYFPLIPNSWAYSGNKSLQRDISAAKKMLEELDWVDSNNNGTLEAQTSSTSRELKLHLLTSDKPTKQSLAKMLAENLKEIGVDLEVTIVSEREFRQLYQSNNYDIYLVTTNVGYDLDLYQFLDEDGKFYFPTELDFDSYQTKLASTDKKEQKQPTYAKLCDDFYENMPHIPLLFLKNTMITSDKFKNLDATANIPPIYPIDVYYNLLRSNVDVKN